MALRLSLIHIYINGEFDAIDPEEILTEDLEELLSADPNVKNYSFTVVGKEIYYRENSVMRPVDVSATAKERIKGMIGIRDCTRALINLQLNEYSDADIKQKQEELSALYDGYTATVSYTHLENVQSEEGNKK